MFLISHTGKGKLLVTDQSPNKPLLPQGEDRACRGLDDVVKCFRAGQCVTVLFSGLYMTHNFIHISINELMNRELEMCQNDQ